MNYRKTIVIFIIILNYIRLKIITIIIKNNKMENKNKHNNDINRQNLGRRNISNIKNRPRQYSQNSRNATEPLSKVFFLVSDSGKKNKNLTNINFSNNRYEEDDENNKNKINKREKEEDIKEFIPIDNRSKLKKVKSFKTNNNGIKTKKNFFINDTNNINFMDINKEQNDQENYKTEDKIENSFNIFRKSINLLSIQIKEKLESNIAELLNCFICYCPAVNPLSCPKCKNFACENCLKSYYQNGNKTIYKTCPCCKEKIRFSELEKNHIISEIKDIVEKDHSGNNLIKLINEKIEAQKEKINTNEILVNKVKDLKTNYQLFKKGFSEFFIECQNLVLKKLEEGDKAIDDLTETFSSYGKLLEDSVKDYEKVLVDTKHNKDINTIMQKLIYSEKKTDLNTLKESNYDNLLKNVITFSPSIIKQTIGKYNVKDSDFMAGKPIIRNIPMKRFHDYSLVLDNKDLVNVLVLLKIPKYYNLNEDRQYFIMFKTISAKDKKEKQYTMKYQGVVEDNLEFSLTLPLIEFFNSQDKVEILADILEFRTK